MGKKEIIEEIEKMSVLDLADLVKELSEKFGVSAMPSVAGVGPAAAGGEAAAPAEEKSEFSVVLKGVGDKKIQVIKVIRELTNLGLKEAKDIADTPPKEVKGGLTKEQAADFKKKLEESGAEVEIK